MRPILHLEAGSTLYATAHAWQLDLHARRLAGEIPDVLLLLEHPHVFTLGRRFQAGHLVLSREELNLLGEVHEADRGGSVTYHGPGQLVAYPVVDLRREGRLPDPIGYLRALERAIINCVAEFGVEAIRRPGLTGVWVGSCKLAALGVNVSRGVSRHGLALNVCTDLGYFSGIVPCGIRDAGVTSLRALLGQGAPTLSQVSGSLAVHLARQLGRRLQPATAASIGLADPCLPPRAVLVPAVDYA